MLKPSASTTFAFKAEFQYKKNRSLETSVPILFGAIVQRSQLYLAFAVVLID
jgi:hypothetical protein